LARTLKFTNRMELKIEYSLLCGF